MSLDDNAELLLDFGLTRNQAKVYLAIVQLGMASVGKISKASKVRREDIYRILPKLEKMGLIEKILGIPIKVRAIPLEDALSILVKREQDIASQRVSSLIAKKETFLKHFIANYKKMRLEEVEEPQFALLSEREAIINKIITLVKNAEKEVDVVTSAIEFFNLLPNLREPLEKTMRKGVKVRVILELHELEDSILRSLQDYMPTKTLLDLRYAYHSLSHYIIADYKQVMMATSPEPPMGEHPYLWTNNKSFVALMQENFEEAWHTSLTKKTIQTSAVFEKVTHFVGELKPTDHVIFVYQSSEAKFNVLFNCLKMGLEKGEAAVYVASDESPTEIRDAMKTFGIEVEKYEKAGALRILGCNDVYIVEGRFNMNATMGMWNKLYSEALRKGFKGMRVTGEMACFFKHNLVDELMEYERALHKVLDVPMIAICAYDANMLTQAHDPINLYSDLVRAHGTVLFAGIDNKLGKIEIRKA